jgi:SAM-dependent methyltransferase
MDAESYERWYESPRGRRIGRRETALVLENLHPRPGESLLDVGCGTGFFTRAFAVALDGLVTGVDINHQWVEYARRHDVGGASYAVADARALPYPNGSFDLVVSIAAICFIEEEITAVREILRVARRRFAIGLLNRQSLLYVQKGRGGGRGGYRGAHWHTVRGARALFHGLPVERIKVRTGIPVPGNSCCARLIERAWPSSLPAGGFILVVGDVAAI